MKMQELERLSISNLKHIRGGSGTIIGGPGGEGEDPPPVIIIGSPGTEGEGTLP